jgi:hypothetical protein
MIVGCTLREPLCRRQDILGTERQPLGFDYAENPTANAKSIIGRTVVGWELLDGTAVKRRKRLAIRSTRITRQPAAFSFGSIRRLRVSHSESLGKTVLMGIKKTIAQRRAECWAWVACIHGEEFAVLRFCSRLPLHVYAPLKWHLITTDDWSLLFIMNDNGGSSVRGTSGQRKPSFVINFGSAPLRSVTYVPKPWPF